MRKAFPTALASCVILFLSAIVSAQGIESFTKPSDDRWGAFIRPGIIGKVLVKEGDMVKEGQLLIQQDDAVEQASLSQLKAEAENEIKIQAAQEDLNKKANQLERYNSVSEHSTSIEEREQARLEKVIAELTLQLSRFQHVQDQLKYKEASLQVERMRLCSPSEGRVETIVPKSGEAVNALDKVVRIVRLDPLWVEVPVGLGQVRSLGLAVGKPANVEFVPVSGLVGKPTLVAAKVVSVQSVADPGSRTLLVRVEVPNKELRQAGEHVLVHFDAAGPIENKAVAQVDGKTANQGEK